MHILLVRHGETSANLERRYEGSGDSPLSMAGQKQAGDLSIILATINIDAVYSSPKKRCLETAKIIANPHRIEVQVTPGLEEVDFGLWEGLTFAEIEQKAPDRVVKWIDDPVHVRPPLGETLEEMASRVFEAYDKIFSSFVGGLEGVAEGPGCVLDPTTVEYWDRAIGGIALKKKGAGVESHDEDSKNRTIVIVTHGGPIRALLSRIDRGDLAGFWEYLVPPCAAYCLKMKYPGRP